MMRLRLIRGPVCTIIRAKNKSRLNLDLRKVSQTGI